MKKHRHVSAEDASLFRDAVGSINPLPDSRRLPPRQPRPSPQPRQTQLDEQDVMDHLLDPPGDTPWQDAGEELEFRQPGVQLAVMRKLRRGQLACQAELDLHGLSLAQARQQLSAFLAQVSARGLRCVRVIHGKGLRSSPRGPVLKPNVARWLQQRQEILAYCSARPVDGGSGALYVLLRKN